MVPTGYKKQAAIGPYDWHNSLVMPADGRSTITHSTCQLPSNSPCLMNQELVARICNISLGCCLKPSYCFPGAVDLGCNH